MSLLLMICATIYEYRVGEFSAKRWNTSVQHEAESLSASTTNNNERRTEYADKNLVGWRVTVQDKELIEKMEKGSKISKECKPVKKDRGIK